MEDVSISKFRAQVVRAGSTPASPGFVVSEGQNPVDPSGSGQNHLPVTIATAATGLSITESQVLGGAGTVGQYIRGDGSLADFPATTGGGSSVSYYLNGSVSQGTIGGVAYKELNRTPIFGAGTDITINADGYIASFITDALDPNKLLIPAGNWNLETYFSANSGGGSPTFYVELYKYNGTTFTLIATSSGTPELIAFGTNINPYFTTLAVPETVLALTDRLALRYYVNTSGRTITLHTEDNHLCQVITTFTTGLTALNGLTNQVQFFAVGSAGTDFAISSASDTHTFNLPTASASNRGALSSADWTTFNNKTSNLGTVTSVGLSSATSGVTIGSTPITTSGTITLAIATASGSQNGLLSSTDWTTFNNKQNALTNPVTGTGTSNTLAKFTGSTTIGNSLFTDNGTNAGYNNAGVAARTFIIQATSGRPLALEVIENSNVHAVYIYPNNSGFNRISSDYMSGGVFLPLSLTGRENNADLVLQTSGNVTIGTTTDAGFKLDVNGTGRFSSTLRVVNAELYLSSGQAITFNGAASGTNPYIYYNSAGNNLIITNNTTNGLLSIGNGNGNLSFASTGAATFSNRVGIGVSPSYPLHITSNIGDYTAAIINTNLSDNAGLLIKAGVNSGNSALRIQKGNSTDLFIVDAGGNVLIGTNTNAGYKLDVNGTGRFISSGGYFSIDSNGQVTSTQSLDVATAGGRFTGMSSRGALGAIHIEQTTTGANGGYIGFRTSDVGSTTPTERMRITSTGNVGINRIPNTSTGILQIKHTDSNFYSGLSVYGTTADNFTTVGHTGSLGVISSTYNSTGSYTPLAFYTSDLERMRITSSGNVLVGKISNSSRLTGPTIEANGTIYSGGGQGGYFFEDRSNSTYWYGWYSTGNTNVFFYNGNAGINIASINPSTGAYVALSDINKKKDFEESNLGLNEIINLKPTLYRMNSDSQDIEKQLGFLAQEVKEFIPQAYFENNGFIGLNYNSIIPVLVNAIKELKQEIDTLKN
jgi:hypothetical protein